MATGYHKPGGLLSHSSPGRQRQNCCQPKQRSKRDDDDDDDDRHVRVKTMMQETACPVPSPTLNVTRMKAATMRHCL